MDFCIKAHGLAQLSTKIALAIYLYFIPHVYIHGEGRLCTTLPHLLYVSFATHLPRNLMNAQAFFDAGRQADLVGFPGETSLVKTPSAGSSPGGSGGSGGVTTRPQHRTAQCYFVSKQLWAKGYRLLFELLAHYRANKGTSGGVAVDLYGSGPDSAAIGEKAVKTKLDVQMKGYADHAKLGQYKVGARSCERRRGLSLTKRPEEYSYGITNSKYFLILTQPFQISSE